MASGSATRFGPVLRCDDVARAGAGGADYRPLQVAVSILWERMGRDQDVRGGGLQPGLEGGFGGPSHTLRRSGVRAFFFCVPALPGGTTHPPFREVESTSGGAAPCQKTSGAAFV